MNFEQLLTTLRTVVEEPTPAFFTDVELKLYLNEADLQIIKELQGGDLFRKTVTIANQPTYFLPAYTLEVSGCTYGDNDKRLTRMSGVPGILTEQYGEPTHFYLPKQGDRLYLWPIPNTSGVTIKIHGRFKSEDMTLIDDTPETPDVLHMALVYWAGMLAWQRRKDSNQASSMMALYNSIMATWDGPVDSGPMYSSYGYSGRDSRR